MKVAFFSVKEYTRNSFSKTNQKYGHEIMYLKPSLSHETCILANDYPAVCAFVNDTLDAGVLIRLSRQGVRLVALRCAGFNNVDLVAAEELGITVVRVPAYSPCSVAEHTVALILALNRRIPRAFNRVRDGNFSIDGLMGFELSGRTVGIVGTGRIGMAVTRIMLGFGCNVLAHDKFENPEGESLGLKYVPLKQLFSESDIITLHCPLMPETHHIINNETLALMKQNVMLINTSRGALIDTQAAIQALKSGKLGYLGLDVYEEESDLFFEDLSDKVIQDDTFARLITFPKVLITGHQAFFTSEALEAIAAVTLQNIAEFEREGSCKNSVSTKMLA